MLESRSGRGFAEIIPFDDASIKSIKGEIEKQTNKQEFLEKVLMDVYTDAREKD